MKLTPEEVALFDQEQAVYPQVLEAIRTPMCAWGPQDLQIACIGNSGGGASVVDGEACGGFLLRYDGRTIVVDPGDNAVSFLVRRGFNPFEITDVLASHTHNDHVGDLSLAVSAAINLGLERACDAHIVVAPTLIDYSNGDATRFGFTLPSYAWQGKVQSLFWRDETAQRFDGETIASAREMRLTDQIRVTATEAHHGGTLVTGFVFDTPMGRIGYTSDTEYFDGLANQFTGADLLWMNMNTLSLNGATTDHTDPGAFGKPIHNHLGYVGACTLIEQVRPQLAVVSHFGQQLIGKRGEVQALLQKRFAGSGTEVRCPENWDSFVFAKSLREPPREEVFHQ